jgi:fatty-acyl-CoA synthase
MPIRLPEMADTAYRYPLLVKHLLMTALPTASQQEIVYRDRARHTYRDLFRRVGRLANALSALGVAEGETVAVMDWDSHRYLECYFAIPMLGAVLQTVNVRLSPELISYTLNHALAQVLLVHQDFLPLLEKIRTQLTTVRTFIVLSEDAHAAASESGFAGEYEALLAGASPDFSFKDFDENALASTFYTTGTTGLPKAVSFTHRQLVLHTLAVLGALASAPDGQSFRRNDVYMPLTPMFHVHAWGLPYVATVMGVKQVYAGRFEAGTVLALRTTESVTYSHCVPTVLRILLDAPAARETDLQGWKLTIGGSALPAGLAQRATVRGMSLFAAYGMSETGPVLTVARSQASDSDDSSRHPASLRKAGVPIPLVEIRVVDEQMREVDHDGSTPGEIVVRAPWLTMAYRSDPRASGSLWRGGYMHTQDIGSLDAEACLEVRDRLKDVIKSGGEWICSLQLEDLILRHPGVAEVAVIGIPDETWGERPLGLIVLRPGCNPQQTEAQILEQLEALARDGLIARYAIPKRLEFVAALDRTSVGKIDKKLMRARFAA